LYLLETCPIASDSFSHQTTLNLDSGPASKASKLKKGQTLELSDVKHAIKGTIKRKTVIKVGQGTVLD